MNYLDNIHIYSEPFSPDGNISGDGATKLLGAVSLTPLELLLRETIQNSWDASIGQATQPSYGIKIRSLNENEKNSLRTFFADLPPSGSKEKETLEDFFSKDYQIVMEICDFGTKGLGGPLSAAKSFDEDAENDFVNFVKNIGSHKDYQNRGGVYGFGKSSLFKMSKCKTIIIDSLATYENQLENRLIGYSLGSEFNFNDFRFTGGHWWGLRVNDSEPNTSVNPILNDGARSVAEDMGLIKRENLIDKGTTIMIIDPDLEELDNIHEILNNDQKKYHLNLKIQDLLLWHAWPKFSPKEDGNCPLKAWISVFGDKYYLPDPVEVAPYNLLVEALQKARKKVEPIKSAKYKKILGYLGKQKSDILIRDSVFKRVLGNESKIPERLSHFALLRPAELIVKYIYKELEEDQPQWGGVFICSEDKEVEQAFAKSEPPAHDDWKPEASIEISPTQKTFVKTALRQIKEEVKKLSGDSNNNLFFDDNEENKNSLAWFASELGKSILGKGMGGSDGKKSNERKKSIGSRKINNSKITKLNYAGTKFFEGKIVADFSMVIISKKGKNIELNLKPSIITDSNEKLFIAPNGRKLEIIRVEAENHFVISKDNNYKSDLTVKDDFKVTEELKIENPKFKLCSDDLKVIVSVEIPDNVAVSLNADLKDNGEI